MIVNWCVCSGPDKSHLLDTKWANTLKEAKAYILSLPLTPIGKVRPYRLYRCEFSSKFSPLTAQKEIESRL